MGNNDCSRCGGWPNFDGSKSKSYCQCTEVDERCNDLESEIERLKAELEDLKAEDKTYLRSEVNRLNNVIADRDWQIDELKAEVEKAKREGVIEGFNQAIDIVIRLKGQEGWTDSVVGTLIESKPSLQPKAEEKV